jgi:cyclin H
MQVRYLEEGTKLMNAPVTVAEIIPAELSLLSGINFDLLCFHPYKAVLAFTEDLRTYLKSKKGRTLAHFRGEDRPVVGQDLKPMHDGARKIVDDVIVSDIPLLYSPGQVGLAALMVTNEELQANMEVDVPRIDLLGYVEHRFDDKTDHAFMRGKMIELCSMLMGLREGKHGCGNHNVELRALKDIHKKLKKCRAWGKSEKSKKRKTAGDEESEAKRTKTY